MTKSPFLAVYSKHLLLATILVATFAVFLNVQEIGDFPIFYEAASLANPYQVNKFFNPAWTHVVILPFRLIPQQVAYALWMTISMAIVLWAVRKLGGDRLSYVLIFASPFFLTFVTKGNLEALVLLGLLIETKPFDVLLLLVKPQMGITAVIDKLAEYKLREWVWLVFLVGMSFVIWGNWPLAMLHNWTTGLTSAEASLDIWPYGVLAGIALLLMAYRERDTNIIFLCGYLLAPYMSHNSIFVYTVVIFSTFVTINRIVLFCAMWLLMIVGLLVLPQ